MRAHVIPLKKLAATALAILTAACDDNNPSNTSEDGGKATLGDAGPGGSSGESGASGSGSTGGSAGAGGCRCTFTNGTHGVNPERGCRLRLRATPEVLVCSTAEGACGGITIGCDLASVTGGILEYLTFPNCPATKAPGWRDPSDAEKARWSSAPDCP